MVSGEISMKIDNKNEKQLQRLFGDDGPLCFIVIRGKVNTVHDGLILVTFIIN